MHRIMIDSGEREMYIVKLTSREGQKFHFGLNSLELDDQIFHSDSLFSCLCNNYIRNNGSEGIDEFIRDFPLISSVFYGININGKEMLFIPKPKHFELPEELLRKDRKIIKKIKFISIKTLNRYNSHLLDESEIKYNARNNLLYLKEETEGNIDLFDSCIDEKASIDRRTGAVSKGMLYIVSSIIPRNGVFLYFMIDKINAKVRECIDLIKCYGIGGEISSGYGLIRNVEYAEQNNFDKNEIKTEHSVNLSLVIPDSKDIENLKNNESSYELIERKGYVSNSNKRRKSCIAIKEGSILPKTICGYVPNISPDEKTQVYRHGKAFMIPIVVRT